MAKDNEVFTVGVQVFLEGSEDELYKKFDGSTERYGRYLFEKARRWPSLTYKVVVAGFNRGGDRTQR